MIKKLIPCLLLIVSLLSAPLIVTEVDAQVASSTAVSVPVKEIPTPVKQEVKKPVVKKKVAVKKKKVVTKRKEKLTTAPALITVDTAPHSPKPIAKKKTTKKKI